MTTEIQAPYRLILAESEQQVMALQAYIQDAYTLEFNARIPHFLPCLLGLYRADGTLVGACGLNHASEGPLYLEQYLEQPIEAAINTRLGVYPARNRIIEVGNLA
ncbi:MAG: thermostable hemolysin, partial [Aeromonas veronii]